MLRVDSVTGCRVARITEYAANKVGSITSDGAVAEYAIPTPNSSPTAIVSASDDSAWFTESFGNKIGKITAPAAVVAASPALSLPP